VLFARLSVFAGGCTLESAEEVCNPKDDLLMDVLDGLASLVDKSLLREQEERGSGEPRFFMLGTIREYALEKLEESGEAEDVRRRHAEFFLALGKEAETELRGPRQGEWLRRLEMDHDNLRASLGWAFDGGDTEVGLRLTGVAWLFWDMRGHLSEGRQWLEKGISLSGPTTTQARAKSLNGAGWIATWQGDYAAAQAFMDESLALHRELGDQEGVADALINLGLVALLGGRNLASVPALVQEVQLLRPRVQDQRTVAYLLILEGLALASQGYEEHGAVLQDETLAAQFRLVHEESLAILREIGDVRGMGICLTNLGLAEVVLGNHVQATTLLRELLRLSLGLDDKLFTQYACFGLACVSASQGQPVRAARLWGAADDVREASGMQLPTQTYLYTNYEDRLTATRTQLGKALFEEAWAEGGHMSPEEVAEYAFSDQVSL
jgi:tetratricopeptide (TPR) repeat protein